MSDCIIIGGGLIGMLTARELAVAGLSVTLLDRGAAGREASWAGGGILSPLYPWRYADAVTRLAQWSQARYESLCDGLREDSGVDPQWTCSGLLFLDTDERAEAAEWARRFGIGLDTLDAAAVAECEPALASPPAGLWMTQVAQVRNPRLVRALRGSIAFHGVRIEEGVEVTAVATDGSRVVGVETRDGRLSAPRVVVAGGAWSARLLHGLGVSLAVEPVRGQMILFAARPGLVHRIVLRGGRYLIPRRDGRVLAGSTLEYVGFDKGTTKAALEELRAAAVALAPALADCPVEHHWAGLRPGCADGVPFVGAVTGIEGLYVNTGHFRNGVVLGPGSARLLADLVLGREPLLDPAPYAINVLREPSQP
ncbi:MAG: glycine oxidase ThiO [Gammaproteobacteria bacterium]